jgi:hypothetical protein
VANFVGSRGAERFFRSRGMTAAAAEVAKRWDEERVFGTFWSGLYTSLDSAFKAHPGDRAARLVARDSVFSHARTILRTRIAPQLGTMDSASIARVRLNTAAVLARRIYLTDLDLFERVYHQANDDIRPTIATLLDLAKADPQRPYASIRTFLGDPVPDSTGPAGR